LQGTVQGKGSGGVEDAGVAILALSRVRMEGAFLAAWSMLTAHSRLSPLGLHDERIINMERHRIIIFDREALEDKATS